MRHRLLIDASLPLGPPRVVHCDREPYHVYIGRWEKWGNPWTMIRDGTREEIIARYEQYVLHSPALMAALPELRGKVLGCWCAPRPCHGDVLVRLANPELAQAASRGQLEGTSG